MRGEGKWRAVEELEAFSDLSSLGGRELFVHVDAVLAHPRFAVATDQDELLGRQRRRLDVIRFGVL